MRRLTAGLIGVVVAACSAGVPTLAEYARDVETLLWTMHGEIDSLDQEMDAQSTIHDLRSYFASRLEVRSAFIEDLEELQPPEQVVELHDAALDVVTRLLAAETDVAEYAATADTVADVLASPQAAAMVQVDEDAIALCLAAQSEFDSADEQRAFIDTPWVPGELKEVINVAFGCEARDRGAG